MWNIAACCENAPVAQQLLQCNAAHTSSQRRFQLQVTACHLMTGDSVLVLCVTARRKQQQQLC